MRWWWKKATPVVVAPDAECPECGHKDGVPVRVIERVRVEGGIPVGRQVGKVYRCARCVTEFMVGPSGVYQPQPRTLPTPDGPSKKRDAKMALRDADQQW